MYNSDHIFWLERQIEMESKKYKELEKKYFIHREVIALKAELDRLKDRNKEIEYILSNEQSVKFYKNQTYPNHIMEV